MTNPVMTKPLLELKGVSKHFPVKKGLIRQKVIGTVRAVDDVSLTVMPGETLAIVGESGCGKSTTARLALCLMTPTEGQIIFEGQDVTKASKQELYELRSKMQVVFQDPYASLNPRMTVGELIAEPMVVHNVGTEASRRERVLDLLRRVDLAPYHANRYPHEFSGGQRQRIGIARALALKPKIIVCDEPVSALDVSIQAQVVNLLKDLQEEMGLSYLFISHGLPVVKHMADRVAVMYLGQVVEIADKDKLYKNPRHPYTQALLAAAPQPDPSTRGKWDVLGGDVPSPLNPPSGCRFHTRCAFATDLCKSTVPALKERETGHSVACHYDNEIPKFVAARQFSENADKLQMRLKHFAERAQLMPA